MNTEKRALTIKFIIPKDLSEEGVINLIKKGIEQGYMVRNSYWDWMHECENASNLLMQDIKIVATPDKEVIYEIIAKEVENDEIS